jgi:NAD(P)H-dependent nitrite reductase small subunit
LSPKKGYKVVIDGREIALFYVDGDVFAIENTCPHQGGELSDGYIKDNAIYCPLHHWSFNLKSGVYTLNTTMKLDTYRTRINEGIVYIDLKSD